MAEQPTELYRLVLTEVSSIKSKLDNIDENVTGIAIDFSGFKTWRDEHVKADDNAHGQIKLLAETAARKKDVADTDTAISTSQASSFAAFETRVRALEDERAMRKGFIAALIGLGTMLGGIITALVLHWFNIS